jgi:hypothetical protein
LGYSAVLAAPSRSGAEGLKQFADVRERFQGEYRRMLQTELRKGLPAAVCTIYDPRYPEPVQRRVDTAALCIINDSIIREAAIAGVPILDLRAVCGDDADFANPIEPSVQGGSKIAAAITSAVTQPPKLLNRIWLGMLALAILALVRGYNVEFCPKIVVKGVEISFPLKLTTEKPNTTTP